MTMFTGLARVAKKTGYPVEETPGWKTDGHGGMTACKSIIIHHTAGSNNGKDYNSYGTVKNGRPGLPGPLAQLGIGRNTGTIYVFAAGKSWHAGKVGKTAHNNDNAIGIEIENNGLGEKYSDKTYKSAVALAGELVQEFGLSVNDVLGHKEIAIPRGRKIDPSFGMDKFRDDVRKYIAGDKVAPVASKPAAKPKPATKPSGKAWPDRALPLTGAHTDESHNAWVTVMKGEGYSYADKDLTKAVQTWLSKPIKGKTYYKGKIDSVWGGWLTESMQEFLVDRGHLPSKAYVDRDRGDVTVIGEKKYLNTQRQYHQK